MKILLVSPSPAGSAPFASSLAAELGASLARAAGGEEALRLVASEKPALVILDEQIRDMEALEFIRRVLMVDAFINLAVITAMSEEEFHQAYEGLGVLAKLPPRPGAGEAKELAEKLRGLSPAA